MNNSESSKRLSDFIEKNYKAYLKRENKAEELLQNGD
jgi:septin family protein